jgi:hypothetical protein
VVAGAACWSAGHIALGAALGEAAERIEGVISTGGMLVLGGLVLVVLVTMALRKRRRKARLAAAEAAVHIVPVERVPQVTRADDADPELEPAG